MDTLEAVYARRSVKHYDPDHEMPEADLTTLLEAAAQSPTSFNIQHWRFVVVKDAALRQKIREKAFDQAQVTDASVLIALTADMQAWDKSPERYWADAPPEVQEFILGMLRPFHEGRGWLHRDEAQRSMGMALQTIMLSAKSMGYDSCPMIGFEIDEVAKLINLPEDHVMGPMVAIGKGTKPAWPKPGQLPLSEVVIENAFG